MSRLGHLTGLGSVLVFTSTKAAPPPSLTPRHSPRATPLPPLSTILIIDSNTLPPLSTKAGSEALARRLSELCRARVDAIHGDKTQATFSASPRPDLG